MNSPLILRRPAGAGSFSWKLAGTLIAAGFLLVGCKTILPGNDVVLGPSYQPSNVYQASTVLPQTVRRVAILPLTSTRPDVESDQGCDTLEPVLGTELAKTKNFELISIPTEQMARWSGKPRWSAEEVLPTNLVHTIRETTGCDALLFARLTLYRAYPPVAIGWNIKLVETKENRILWSVDEVFDAGDTAVANAARRYYQQHIGQPEPLADSQSVLSSPRRFGQYSLHAVFATLPAR